MEPEAGTGSEDGDGSGEEPGHVAPEHEAPEHEPPGHRPKKRTDTLGDVQRALRIRGARPKLAGRRAKPGIRKWRETSVARCSGGCPLPLPRGCGGLARPLAVHCYAPLTASSACGCRPPPARRLRVRRRLPPAARPPSYTCVMRGRCPLLARPGVLCCVSECVAPSFS